ncbi:hypothetical protein IWX50DRAFT_615624 [Phyllosticta citricarpa]|uniref:Uncharacterized protein n=1 Tax=Phyllosticta citricarpa TaxID=55181 RepID=A0ABR1MFI5_9PEZI
MSSSVFMFPGPIHSAPMAGQSYHRHIPSLLAERHGVLDTPDMSFAPSAPFSYDSNRVDDSTSYALRGAVPYTAHQAYSHTPHKSCAGAETSFRRPVSTTMSPTSSAQFSYSATPSIGNRFSLPASHPSSSCARNRDSTTTTAATSTTPTTDPTTRITVAKQRAIGHRRSHAQSIITEPQKQLGHRRSCALQIRPSSLDQQKARGHRRSHAQFTNVCSLEAMKWTEADLRLAAEIAIMRSFRGPILGERTDWGGGGNKGRSGRSSAPPGDDRSTGDNNDKGERDTHHGGQPHQRLRAGPLFTPEQLRQAMAEHGQVPKVFTPRSVSASQHPRLSALFPDHDIPDDDPPHNNNDRHDHHRRGRTKDKKTRSNASAASTPETPKPDERLLLGARAAAAGIPRDTPTRYTPTRSASACSPRDHLQYHDQHPNPYFGPLTGRNKPLPALPPPSTNDLFLVNGQQMKQLQQLQQLQQQNHHHEPQHHQPYLQHHPHPQPPQPAHLSRAHSPHNAAFIPRPLNIVKKNPSRAPSTATSTGSSSTPHWTTPPTTPTPVPVPAPLVWRPRTPSHHSQFSQYSQHSNGSNNGGGLVGPVSGLSSGLSSSASFGPSGPPPASRPPALPPLHHHQFPGRRRSSSSSNAGDGAGDTDIEYAAVSTEFGGLARRGAGGRARSDSTNTLDRIEAELVSWAGLQECEGEARRVSAPQEEREEMSSLFKEVEVEASKDAKGKGMGKEKEKAKQKKDDKEKEKDKEKKWWGKSRKDKKGKKEREKAEREKKQQQREDEVGELDEEAYDAEDDWEDE